MEYDLVSASLLIRNVHFCYQDASAANELYDVACSGGLVLSVDKSTEGRLDVPESSATIVVDACGRGLLIPR